VKSRTRTTAELDTHDIMARRSHTCSARSRNLVRRDGRRGCQTFFFARGTRVRVRRLARLERTFHPPRTTGPGEAITSLLSLMLRVLYCDL